MGTGDAVAGDDAGAALGAPAVGAAVGVAVGAPAVGVGVGVAVGAPAVGAPVGAAVGVAVGVAVGTQHILCFCASAPTTRRPSGGYAGPWDFPRTRDRRLLVRGCRVSVFALVGTID